MQAKLKACSTKYVKEEKELKNPLAGIMRCSECGFVMARFDRKQSVYYRPRGDRSNPIYYPAKPIIACTHKCKTKSHTLEYVEVALIESLKEWIIQNKKVIEDYSNNQNTIISNIVNQLEVLNKELDKEKIKLERLRDFLDEGIYDKKTYLERSKIVEDSISTLNAQISKISTENEEIKMEKLKTLIPKVETCISEYFNLSVKEKNEMLRSIIEKVIYTKTQVKSNCDLRLDIHMKI